MASRLIDKLLANPSISDAEHDWMLRSHVINADNIVEYISNSVDGKKPFDAMDMLPSITPPFHSVFIQYNAGGIERGCLINRQDTDQNEARWRIVGNIYSDQVSLDYAHIGQLETLLTYDGFLFPDWKNKTRLGYVYPYSLDGDEPDMHLWGIFIASLWTLAFMNCKNTVLEPVEPNAQEQKRRAKHGKLPLMRYHVLKIKPFGGRSDSEGQGGTHASPALHIRRGHFATYTDAAPLFGKYVGTYWKDQMLVGRKSDRVVVKDYEMDLTSAE